MGLVFYDTLMIRSLPYCLVSMSPVGIPDLLNQFVYLKVFPPDSMNVRLSSSLVFIAAKPVATIVK